MENKVLFVDSTNPPTAREGQEASIILAQDTNSEYNLVIKNRYGKEGVIVPLIPAKEQRVVISTDSSRVNEYLTQGWIVESITAGHLAKTGTMASASNGNFCFLLSKNK